MMNHNLLQTASQTIERFHMLSKGDAILAAVSGGADSMALLWLLCQLREPLALSLMAAHVNHGLRGKDADADQALVEEICRKFQVPLRIHKVDIAALCRQTGEGEEACGRRVRYEFFQQTAGSGKIATAHTANDNAETVFMNLIRGTGLQGLCGIPPVRGNIIRPLIACTRDMTEHCCHEQNIVFAHDATNDDDRYLRNSVRHSLIPFCKQQNPAFLQAVGRSVTANRRDYEYLAGQAAALLMQSKLPRGYNVHLLTQVPEALQYYAVKQLLENECSERYTATHIDSLLQLLHKGKGHLSLPGAKTAVVTADLLQIHTVFPKSTADFAIAVQLGQSVEIENRQFLITPENSNQKICNLLTYNQLDCDTIGKNLMLRNRRPGDAITLPKRHCTKTLKKLLNEMKVPPHQRARLWILCDENGILWVEGIGCDARCAVTANTRHIATIHC